MFYKLTVKKNSTRYPTLAQYINVMRILEDEGLQITEYHYEIDSINKLHLHCLIEGRTNYYIKKIQKLFEGTGTHVYFEKFKKQTKEDIQGWVDYMRKDQNKIQEQIAEYYRLYVVPEGQRALDQALGYRNPRFDRPDNEDYGHLLRLSMEEQCDQA